MSGAPAVMQLQAGDRLGPYRLEEVLGEGGVGIVFRAVREDDGAVVALKVLREELSADETYRQRFAREGRIASGLSHAHLVPVVDAGEADGRPYLATRYVEGATLADLLDEGPLPVPATLRVVSELALAVDALHREGLVHRDLKPSNVLLDESGRSLLTDFGLAKGEAATVLTKPGHVVGTLHYLPPEVIEGSSAGPAADIYALGCVTYECLAGAPPFAGESLVQTTLAILNDEPPDLAAARDDVPEGLSFALCRALAKRPEDRPATAAAYALMLRVSARPA
jgi:serine/threonine protein kinase